MPVQILTNGSRFAQTICSDLSNLYANTKHIATSAANDTTAFPSCLLERVLLCLIRHARSMYRSGVQDWLQALRYRS